VRQVWTVLAGLALATSLAACGDSGPTKADFTAKADSACTPGNTSISTTAKPTNAPQVASAAGSASATVDGQVTSLRALKLPGGKDKAQVQGILTAIADVATPTKALQDAAAKNDDAGMAKAAIDMQAKADAAHNSAQAYGLAQCGVQLKFGLGNMFDGVKNVVKAGFLSKAETACRDFGKKANALGPLPASAAARIRWFDSLLGLMRKLSSDLSAAPAPPGDESAVAEVVAAFDAFTAKTNEFVDALRANNAKLIVALGDEVDVAGTALTAKFDAYGLRVCGSVGK